MSRVKPKMPLTKVTVKNSCNQGVVIRNHLTDRSRAQTACENGADPTAFCQIVQSGEAFDFDIDDSNRAALTSAALSLSWDEKPSLGTQLPCIDYTFCQGIEIQDEGRSFNFDNQRGYSFPIRAEFQKKRADGTYSRICYDAEENSQACAFDVLQGCPEEHRFYVGDEAAGYLSHVYCVSPDNNRACMTEETAGSLTKEDCARIRPDELGLSCTVGSSCTDSWCASRTDVALGIKNLNVLRRYPPRKSPPLKKLPPVSLLDARRRPISAEAIDAGYGDAGLYQISVDAACEQGVTNHFTGSFHPGPLKPMTDPALDRVPLRGGSGTLKSAISYECDGVNQYCGRGQASCPMKADMAGNVGAKCPDGDPDRILIEVCPNGS
jgi:hypothetical protein